MMTHRKLYFLHMLLLLLTYQSPSAFADTPCEWIDLEPILTNKISVGDTLSFKCKADKDSLKAWDETWMITLQDDTKIYPLEPASVGKIQDSGVIITGFQKVDDQHLQIHFVVLQPSAQTIPALKLRNSAFAKKNYQLTTTAIAFQAQTTAQEQTQAPPIMPLLAITMKKPLWLEHIWKILGALAMLSLALMLIGYFLWRRGKKRHTIILPHMAALAEIKALRKTIIGQALDYETTKACKRQINNALKNYLQEGFELAVRSKTVNELSSYLLEKTQDDATAWLHHYYTQLMEVFRAVDPYDASSAILSQEAWITISENTEHLIEAIHKETTQRSAS